MKIRTDFVTNSSSSSFVIELSLELENDEKVTISAYEEYDGDYIEDMIDGPVVGDFFIKEKYAKILQEIDSGANEFNGKKVNKVMYMESIDGFNEGDDTYHDDIAERIKEDLETYSTDENLEFFKKFIEDEDDYPQVLTRKVIYDLNKKETSYEYSDECDYESNIDSFCDFSSNEPILDLPKK